MARDVLIRYYEDLNDMDSIIGLLHDSRTRVRSHDVIGRYSIKQSITKYKFCC